jgi:hypothetical protein
MTLFKSLSRFTQNYGLDPFVHAATFYVHNQIMIN